MALFYQFASMFCFGITNCLWKPPLAELPVSILIFARTILTTTFFVILVIAIHFFNLDLFQQFHKPIAQLSIIDVLITVGICAINYWGLFFYNKSLSYGRAGIAVVITCMGLISSILLSIFVYGQGVTKQQSVVMVCFVVAIWFLENLDASFLRLKPSKGVRYAMLSLAFWSTWPLFPIAFERVGVLWFCLILETTVLSLTFFVICASGELRVLGRHRKLILKNMKWILPLGVLGFSGVLFSNLSMSGQTVSSYAIFGLVQPLISLLFAAAILKERLSRLQYVGIAIMLGVLVFG